MTEADVQDQLRPFRNYFENLPFDRMTMEFFERVNFIQQNMIPQIRDLTYKRDFFQKQLEIKKYSTIVIIYIIIMSIFGVTAPLFVHISYQPPLKHKNRVGHVEKIFLIGTMIMHVAALLVLLKIVLEMNGAALRQKPCSIL